MRLVSKKGAFLIGLLYLHIIRVISVGNFTPLHMRLQTSLHSLKTFCESASRTAPYCPHSARNALILIAVFYSLTSSLMITHCFIFFNKHDCVKLKNIFKITQLCVNVMEHCLACGTWVGARFSSKYSTSPCFTPLLCSTIVGVNQK